MGLKTPISRSASIPIGILWGPFRTCAFATRPAPLRYIWFHNRLFAP